jgi:transcriptional regulator with XRE-family HTH domain
MTSERATSRTAIKRPGAGIGIDRDQLVRLRQGALLSRAQLASAMSDDDSATNPDAWSITPDAIAKIENGWRRPKTATLARLCKALGCTPEDLLPQPGSAPLAPCPHCGGRYGHEPGCRDAT